MALFDQRYRGPPVERAAGMADSERPHLTQADPKFLGHLEKRVLVIEPRGPAHPARRFVDRRNRTFKDDGKLIVERSAAAVSLADVMGVPAWKVSAFLSRQRLLDDQWEMRDLGTPARPHTWGMSWSVRGCSSCREWQR